MLLFGEMCIYVNVGDYCSVINVLLVGLLCFDNVVFGQVMFVQLYFKIVDFNGYKCIVNRLFVKFFNDFLLGKVMSGVVFIMLGDYKKGIVLIEFFVDKIGNEDFFRWLIFGFESMKQGVRIEQVLNVQFLL